MDSNVNGNKEDDSFASIAIELTSIDHSKIAEDTPPLSETVSPNPEPANSFNVESTEHLPLRPEPDKPTWKTKKTGRIKSILIKHFLPIGFLFALGIAILFPLPGRELGSIRVHEFGVFQTLCVCVIFFISGLLFKTSDIHGIGKIIIGLIYGVVSILVLSPSTGLAVMKLKGIPHHFRVGLSIFLSVPTTLTMGIALVDQAGGNTTLALLLIITSNLVGILTVPFAVKLILGSQSEASIDAIQLLLKLLLSILTPLILGKGLMELSTRIQKFVMRWKKVLGLVNNGACVTIVWLSLSRSRKQLLEQRVTHVLTLLLLCCCLHLTLLFANYFVCSILKLPGREKMAVVILSSQKTFPVALAVISYLDPEEVGELGLLTIPCIIGQMTQLFLDSLVLSKWKYENEI